MYKVIVEYYRNKQDLETGNPCKIADRGLDNLSLDEAYACKSKMPEEPVCGMARVNKIVCSDSVLQN